MKTLNPVDVVADIVSEAGAVAVAVGVAVVAVAAAAAAVGAVLDDGVGSYECWWRW